MSEGKIERYYTYGFPIHEYSYVIAIRDNKLLFVSEEDKKGRCNIYTREKMDSTGVGKTLLVSALYVLGKQKTKEFKQLYKILEKFDMEYFKIAEKSLQKIKNDYEF